MASKKQENFEDQDQLGPDHGKVQKNVTSNHPQKICGKCKKLFSTWTNLKKHLLKTHNVKPFTWCHLCNLELNSARELKKHFIDIHTISKPKRIEKKTALNNLKKPYLIFDTNFLSLLQYGSSQKLFSLITCQQLRYPWVGGFLYFGLLC